MIVCCPRDGKELCLDKLAISLEGKSIPVVIGTCPRCHAKFINRLLIEGCSFLTIDKVRYEILPQLNDMISQAWGNASQKDARIVDIEEKIQKKIDKFERGKERRRVREEQLKAQKEKERAERQAQLKAQKEKERAERQAQLKVQQEQERQRQLAEKKRRSKEKQEEQKLKRVLRRVQDQQSNIENQRKKIERFSKKSIAYPRDIIQPRWVMFYNQGVKRCLCDQSPLVDVRLHKVFGDRIVRYCDKCRTLFLPEYLRYKPDIPQLTLKNLQDGHENPRSTASNVDGVRKVLETYAAGVNNLPSSTICTVRLQDLLEHKELKIVVVSNVHEQDTARGVYWIGRTLPSMLLTLIQMGSNKQFTYKGGKYRVIGCMKNLEFESYAKTITKFCDPIVPQTVYVFAQKNIAHFHSQNYELVTAMVPCTKSSFPVPISVYYDKLAHTYFINEESYALARERYGLPYLRIRPALSDQLGGKVGGLRAHSELYLLGYSVDAKTGSDTAARRQVLKRILDSGILKRSEVINHLEWLIHTRAGMPHMDNAVAEWKTDLQFVSAYNVDRQRKVWVDEFRAKYNLSIKG